MSDLDHQKIQEMDRLKNDSLICTMEKTKKTKHGR